MYMCCSKQEVAFISISSVSISYISRIYSDKLPPPSSSSGVADVYSKLGAWVVSGWRTVIGAWSEYPWQLLGSKYITKQNSRDWVIVVKSQYCFTVRVSGIVQDCRESVEQDVSDRSVEIFAWGSNLASKTAYCLHTHTLLHSLDFDIMALYCSFCCFGTHCWEGRK